MPNQQHNTALSLSLSSSSSSSVMQSVNGTEEETNRGLTTLNLIHRRCSAPLSLSLTNHRDAAADNATNKPFSYHKLPKNNLLNLSVLKLDGSLFEVHVANKATVGDLKQAIEEIFGSSLKDGPDKISWSHVWGHFCLCYEDQKLLSDKAHIQNFGIKDGDRLRFIRHMSINFSPLEKLTKSEGVTSKKSWRSKPGSNGDEEREEGGATDYDYEDEEAPTPEFKLAHFLKGWFSYSRLRGLTRKGSEDSEQSSRRPSRCYLQCLGGRPKVYSCKSS